MSRLEPFERQPLRLPSLPELSVLLSDQRMPGMGGDELLARAKQISRAAAIMVTGYADLDAVVRAVNEGRIFGYITKPWNQEQLLLMVHSGPQSLPPAAGTDDRAAAAA